MRQESETHLPTGACTINQPCAQQYAGKYQSCMVISGRLIVHAPVGGQEQQNCSTLDERTMVPNAVAGREGQRSVPQFRGRSDVRRSHFVCEDDPCDAFGDCFSHCDRNRAPAETRDQPRTPHNGTADGPCVPSNSRFSRYRGTT